MAKQKILPYCHSFVFYCPCFVPAHSYFDHAGPCFLLLWLPVLSLLAPVFSLFVFVLALLFPFLSLLVSGPYEHNWYIARRVLSPKPLLLTQMFLVTVSIIIFVFFCFLFLLLETTKHKSVDSLASDCSVQNKKKLLRVY